MANNQISEKLALQKAISAIELLSTILHELEAKGVELSVVQDHQWGAATGVCEEIKKLFN